MSQWINVCHADALPVGTHKTLLVNEHPVAVFHLEDGLYAVEDCCTHKGLPISEGPVEADCITCPFHGARFCLKTGEAKSSPAFVALKTYTVRIENEQVQVSEPTLTETSS